MAGRLLDNLTGDDPALKVMTAVEVLSQQGSFDFAQFTEVFIYRLTRARDFSSRQRLIQGMQLLGWPTINHLIKHLRASRSELARDRILMTLAVIGRGLPQPERRTVLDEVVDYSLMEKTQSVWFTAVSVIRILQDSTPSPSANVAESSTV